MIGITQISVFIFLIAGLIYSYVKREGRFAWDWAPFLILWLTYDQMRGIADNQNHINVKPVYDLEYKIFAWMFGGQIPNEWAQSSAIQNEPTTLFFSFLYIVHPIAPLILAIYIYYGSKDKETFKEFSHAFLLTSYLALITFALYPVAPPWYVAENGFTQPTMLTNVAESAAGLLKADTYLGITAFANFYRDFNANPYAAVPSLHAAFSYFVAYYAIRKYKSIGPKIYLIIIYPLIVWIAAVYLNHHYIVDLIIGIGYSYFSIRTIRFIHRRRREAQAKKNTEKSESPKASKNVENLEIPTD
ncbi:MAG: inositol phosphorylceramide synthase [Candidatus Heimdallarchaeota archaeon]|nr:inositol phosphorylceramide synthase [Candidatus Heimdallarchaeota archaeon]